MLLFDWPRRRPSHDLACAARQRKPTLGRAHAGECVRSAVKNRPISTRNRARCDYRRARRNARVTSVPLGTSPGHASPSARASANNTGRLASETTVRRVRNDGTRPRPAPSTPAAPRHPRAEEPLVTTRNQARSASRTRDALSTSAVSAGISASRAARPAARAPRAPSSATSHRDARDDQLVGRLQAGGKGRGVEPGEHMLGLVEAADQEQAADLEIARMRGVHVVVVRFERRPRRSFVGQPRSRETSAPSRPRRRHTWRGPPLLSDRRRAPRFATEPSRGNRDRRAAPSRCPAARAQARRHAGRPASMPRGSPVASARAAGDQRVRIGIPPNL